MLLYLDTFEQKEYFFVSFCSKSIDLEIGKKRRVTSGDLIAILKMAHMGNIGEIGHSTYKIRPGSYKTNDIKIMFDVLKKFSSNRHVIMVVFK